MRAGLESRQKKKLPSWGRKSKNKKVLSSNFLYYFYLVCMWICVCEWHDVCVHEHACMCVCACVRLCVTVCMCVCV